LARHKHLPTGRRRALRRGGVLIYEGAQSGTIEAGFNLSDRMLNVSAGYKGELGNQYVRQGAAVKVTIPF
jgi:hypothetical protein